MSSVAATRLLLFHVKSSSQRLRNTTHKQALETVLPCDYISLAKHDCTAR